MSALHHAEWIAAHLGGSRFYVEHIRWSIGSQAGRVAPMDGRARVAWNLRKIRVDRGLSQESLAVDANVDRGYVSGIERMTYNPTLSVLDRLADALAIDVALLFVDPPEGSDTPQPLRAGRRAKA